MATLMMYVGGPTDDDRDDLRHTLRSWCVNAPWVTDVWCVGDVPDWFAGARMPLPPVAEKFANARQSITRFVESPAAPETFILSMDDVVVKRPIDDIPICHLGPTREYSVYKDHGQQGTYARAMRDTADWIHTQHGIDPLGYLAHTPLPLNTAKVREFLATYPPDRLLEPFLLYAVAGAADAGSRTGNAKCKGDDNFEHKLGLPIPFLSSNPDSWAGALGAWVRETFPTPCRYEK